MGWALEQIAEAGFTPITVPAIAREQAFLNQGQFPGHREETYELPNDDLWLAGTAEVVLTSLHSGEIIEGDKLPILYAGFSPCFRREAGSAGKDVRGLLRVHQFVKVEQYVICEADDALSAEWHAKLLRARRGACSQALEIPYQVIETSTGDMGLGKYRMNDIESWVPSLGKYRETHSCSTLHDWQARRANIRYRGSDGKVRFAHTLNNTALASPADPRAAAGEPPDRGRAGEAAQGAAGADGERISLKYHVHRATTGRRPAWRRLAEAAWLLPDASGTASASVGVLGPEDGPPALVIPGFLATDQTCMELRRSLARRGWRTYPWDLGLNRGAHADVLRHLRQRLEVDPRRAAGAAGRMEPRRRCSRASWRARCPEMVRAVVTLGSPFSGDPHQNNVWRLYEWVTGHTVDEPPVPHHADKPPVPTLAIWSRRDGSSRKRAARGLEGERDKAGRDRLQPHGVRSFAPGGAADRARDRVFLHETEGKSPT